MKKVFEKTVKKLVKACLFGTVLVIFASCGEDAGLGASVDTEAPKIEITYPPSSSIIRENFILAGTCNDDMGVSSVKITITNSETKETVDSDMEAVVDGKSWYISLNPKTSDEKNEWGLIEYKYPDGKYEISVTACDSAGHASGKNSRTFEIDNTPPIFFITSPQIDDANDMTNYGTRLKIVGTIADEHKVEKMQLVVKNDSGDVVADSQNNPITVNNVTTAGGTSETVASFLSTDTTGNILNDNYIDIYFDDDSTKTKSGTYAYSCEITLIDEAQIYREPENLSRVTQSETEETDGNAGSRLFAYYNIRDSEGVGSDNFDANKMMKVINGTYSDDNGICQGETYEAFKAALKAEGNSNTCAKFTLNPKANPTYSVIGFGFDKSPKAEEVWSETTKGAKISVVAQQGLNQTVIDKNSATAFIAGPFPVAADEVQQFITDNKIFVDKLYADVEDLSDTFYKLYKNDKSSVFDESAFNVLKAKWTAPKVTIDDIEYTNPIKYFEKYELEGTATGSGESYTYPYKLPDDGLDSGSAYLVLMTGWDKDGLVLSNGDKYSAFKFTVSGNIPTFRGVKFSKNDDSLSEDDKIVATGGYTNLYDLSITGSANGSSKIAKLSYKLTVTDEDDSDKEVTSINYEKTYDMSEALTTQDFSFNLLENATNGQKTILSKSGVRYLYTVELYVEDEEGKNYTTEYIVHLDKKSPVIAFTTAKPVYEESSEKIWISASGLTQLRGSIEEETIKEVTYTVKKNGIVLSEKENKSIGATYSFFLGSDTTSTRDGEKSAFDGISLEQDDTLQVVVNAEDKAGNKGSAASPVYTVDATSPLMVTSDSETAKAIRIGGKKYDQTDETWLKDTALTFEGYYKENESGVSAVYYCINPATVPTKGSDVKAAAGRGAMGADSAGKFSSTISGFNDAGASKIYMAAEDNAGNFSSVVSYTIYIDQKGPAFDVSSLDDDDLKLPANMNTESVSFSIPVADAEGGSGVDDGKTDGKYNIKVLAIYNGKSYDLSDCGEDYYTQTYKTNADGVSILTGTIKKAYFAAETHTITDKDGTQTEALKFDGNVPLQITVPDKAGNTSQNMSFTLQLDSSAPTVEVLSPAKVTATQADKISWITGKITVNGSIQDNLTGVDKENFKFVIPTVTQQKAISDLGLMPTSAEKIAALGDVEWKDFTKNDGVTWSIVYDSSYLEAEKRNGKNSLVYYGAATSSGKLIYAEKFSEDDDRYRIVPVYFLVTDKAGNQDVITDNKFYIDIEGGKPAASISYPKESVTDSSGKDSWQKLSEEISLQGVAKDNEAITKIALTELYYASYDTTASDTDSISQQVYSAGENYAGWKKINLDSDVKIIQPNKTTETLKISGSGSDSVIEQTVTGQASVEAFDIEFTLAKEKESDADLIVDKLAKKNKKIIAIKAVVSAFDENEYGYSSTRMAFVDTEAPKLSGAKLVKLDSALAGSGISSSSVSSGVQIGRVENGKVYGSDGTELVNKVLVDRPYETDMWISGGKDGDANWYYVATVTDDSVVEGVNLTSLSDDAHKVVFKTEKGEMAPASKTKTYTFAIPIPVSSDGSIYSQLALEDGSHKGINEYISINIDNTAPGMFDSATSLVATGDASKTSIDDGKLRLVADGILGEKYVIENSNGSFSFGDKVYETGSGLSFIGFWIERASKKAVYNPIIKEDSAYRIYSSGDEMKSAIYATEKPSSAGLYLNSDKLPVLYVPAGSVTVGSNSSTKTTTITYSGLASDSFINRAYGRVRINGSYYQVTDISSNTATLDSDLGLKNGSGVVVVEFVYAAFVDKNGTELFQWGSEAYSVSGDESESGSDLGDGLAESLKVKSGVYTWTAEFDSNNIEDGPARIHVVALDNAGNVNHAYVDTSVQNNRPRIAKVFVATDLNVDNKFKFDEDVFKDYAATFDEAFGQSKADAQNPYLYNSPAVENGLEMGEFVFYSTLDKNNDASAFAVLSDKGVNGNFIAKDAVLILPEIVGGNIAKGDIKYNMEESEADTDISKKAPSEPKTGSNTLSELVTFTNGSASAGGTSISITNKDLASAASQLPQKGIYLSGEKLKDYESWTSEGKKSRYLSFTLWDTTGVDTSADSLTQGENTLWAVLAIPMVINVVDEEAPLPLFDTLYWKSKEDSSTVYDENEQPLGHVDTEEDLGKDNPEVAGEIYIRGQVTDGSLVQSISIIEPDSSASVKVAEYKEGKWRSFNGSTPTYFDKTSGEMLEDDSAYKFDVSGLPENWKSFEITSEREPSQKDHKVDFRFRVDTTKFGVASDQEFKIVASDKGDKNESAPSTTQTTAAEPTSLYRMDFVPYIRTITLADGNEVNRSRLGRYPVRAGEKIRIYGMNFKAGETASVNYYDSENGISASGSPASTESGTVKTDSVNGNYVEVASPDYSRFVSVTVQGTVTANNTNSNLKGNNIEEGYLASEKTTLGLKKAGTNGTNFWTDDRYLAVWNVETTFAGSINPHSGVIKKVDSGNSDDGKIYSKETGSAGVDAVSGLNDTYFAALSSDDLRVYTYDLGSLSENSIGNRYTFGQNNTDIFGVPADALDCVILEGMPYYVVQDNWVGNVDANCWGPGLYMARAGWQWNKSDLNSNGNPANQGNYHIIIEKQGDSGTARGRSSELGYDYVLQQFKNPRITGWHKDEAELTYDANKSAYAPSTDYIYVSYYDSYARCLKYAAYRAGHRINANGKYDYVGGMWGSDTGRSGGAGGDLSKEMRMADDMTGGKAVVAGFDTLNDNPTSFVEEAGEWSDILVDTSTTLSDGNHPPLIIYYNKTKKSLEVAVGKQAFPSTGNVIARDSATSTDNSEISTGWTKYKGITPNSKVDFGRYVSAAIDKAGNLHVAAQDATNAKLYYLLLEKSNNYGVKVSAIVDSTSGAGRWTDIELTNPDGESLAEIKPVISYINTSFLGTTQGVKVAYLESVTGTGASATLNFEAMTDPAKWQAGDQRTSVLPDVKESKGDSSKALVGVGFNSDMLALDFLRGE